MCGSAAKAISFVIFSGVFNLIFWASLGGNVNVRASVNQPWTLV
jgi:hypothetical protein